MYTYSFLSSTVEILVNLEFGLMALHLRSIWCLWVTYIKYLRYHFLKLFFLVYLFFLDDENDPPLEKEEKRIG